MKSRGRALAHSASTDLVTSLDPAQTSTPPSSTPPSSTLLISLGMYQMVRLMMVGGGLEECMGSAWGSHWTLAFDIGQEDRCICNDRKLKEWSAIDCIEEISGIPGHRKKVRTISFFLLQCPPDLGTFHTSRATEQARPMPSLPLDTALDQ